LPGIRLLKVKAFNWARDQRNIVGTQGGRNKFKSPGCVILKHAAGGLKSCKACPAASSAIRSSITLKTFAYDRNSPEWGGCPSTGKSRYIVCENGIGQDG
jgi:hypothetical protein